MVLNRQYLEMYRRSVRDPAGFWGDIAAEFYWKEKWDCEKVCSENLDVRKGTVEIEVKKMNLSTCCNLVFDIF